MPQLKWSAAALADIGRLNAFLASKNRDAAKRAIGVIRQGVNLLGRHPEAGRPVDGMPAAFRQWPIAFGAGGYLVLNRLDGNEAVILSVRHGREAGE